MGYFNGISRMITGEVPNHPQRCPYLACDFNRDGTCEQPRRNKRHLNAMCHRSNNQTFSKILREGTRQWQEP